MPRGNDDLCVPARNPRSSCLQHVRVIHVRRGDRAGVRSAPLPDLLPGLRAVGGVIATRGRRIDGWHLPDSGCVGRGSSDFCWPTGCISPTTGSCCCPPLIPMPARASVVVYAVIELYLGVTGSQAGVAHSRIWRHDRWLHHSPLLARLGCDAKRNTRFYARSGLISRRSRSARSSRPQSPRSASDDLFPAAFVGGIARVDAIEVLLLLCEQRILRGELGLGFRKLVRFGRRFPCAEVRLALLQLRNAPAQGRDVVCGRFPSAARARGSRGCGQGPRPAFAGVGSSKILVLARRSDLPGLVAKALFLGCLGGELLTGRGRRSVSTTRP